MLGLWILLRNHMHGRSSLQRAIDLQRGCKLIFYHGFLLGNIILEAAFVPNLLVKLTCGIVAYLWVFCTVLKVDYLWLRPNNPFRFI